MTKEERIKLLAQMAATIYSTGSDESGWSGVPESVDAAWHLLALVEERAASDD